MLRPSNLRRRRVYGHVPSNYTNTSFQCWNWYNYEALPPWQQFEGVGSSEVGYVFVLITCYSTGTYTTKGSNNGIFGKTAFIIRQKPISFLHYRSCSAYSTRHQDLRSRKFGFLQRTATDEDVRIALFTLRYERMVSKNFVDCTSQKIPHAPHFHSFVADL